MIHPLFPVTEHELRKLTAEALKRGGAFADLYFEQTVFDDLSLRDGIVARAGRHQDYGMGVRTLLGEKTGYAFTEDLEFHKMEEAARVAACIADGPVKGSLPGPEPEKLCRPGCQIPDYYPVRTAWEEVALNQKIAYLQQLNAAIFGQDKRMQKVMAGLSHAHTDILYFNSEGTLCTDSRPIVSLSVSCVLREGSRTEKASASRSYRMGAEFLTAAVIEEICKDIATQADHLFKAVQPKGGVMPVVLGAGASGILLHEAIGHAFEADFIRKNTSIFTGSLGKRICIPEVSVVDDATVPANRGALNVDDEGVPGQKTYMVREGVLTGFLHDRMSARLTGAAPTGNGRRESFRYAPLPRMRATYMENGTARPEDLVKEVKKGIYVDTFSNGQVDIGGGDFTFYVKTGRLIENGCLTREIKDFNIIGNGPEALAGITAVAADGVIDNGTWTCGKGQSVAVSCGMPSVLVNRLTVGGC